MVTDEMVEAIELLTPDEHRCCHMVQWTVSIGSLEQWRKEFSEMPRSELCRDCPARVDQ